MDNKDLDVTKNTDNTTDTNDSNEVANNANEVVTPTPETAATPTPNEVENNASEVVTPTPETVEITTPNTVENNASEVVTPTPETVEITTPNTVENNMNEVGTVIPNAPKSNGVSNVTVNNTFEEVANNDTSNKYNITLLLNYFLGNLGVHRIINGKKVSGGAMLVITLLVSPIFITLLLLGLIYDNTALTVVGMIGIPIILTIDIVAIVDFIMILCGSFKNSNKVAIKSNKPFFKNWVHYLVIGFLLLSMISSIIFGVFFAAPMMDYFDELSNDVVEDDKSDEDEDDDKSDYKDGSVEKTMGALDYCMTGNGDDDITFDSYEEFAEPLIDYFEDLDYETYEDEEDKDYISLSKEIGDGEITLAILLEEDEDDDTTVIGACDIEVYESIDDVYYRISIMNGSYTSYNDDFIYDISASNYSDDDEFSYYGEYDSGTDEYELSDFDTEEEYDFDKDERGFIEVFERLFETLEDERDEVLDY